MYLKYTFLVDLRTLSEKHPFMISLMEAAVPHLTNDILVSGQSLNIQLGLYKNNYKVVQQSNVLSNGLRSSVILQQSRVRLGTHFKFFFFVQPKKQRRS